MGKSNGPVDLQDAVERSYRAQWGGRRFCLITGIVLLVLAVVSAVVLVVAKPWFQLTQTGLQIVEIAALATSLICLIAAVMFSLESLIRWQREKGQLPDRVIHAALCCSVVTVAIMIFCFFLSIIDLKSRGVGASFANVVMFVLILFAGLSWLASVVLSSAGITLLVSRRTDLLEVNNTTEGTALLFRKGHSTEIVKLSIAAIVPLILFVVALLMAGAYII